jgi:hypothetical protein
MADADMAAADLTFCFQTWQPAKGLLFFCKISRHGQLYTSLESDQLCNAVLKTEHC